MHALIVVAHPEPRSFNGQLAAIAADTLRAAGHTVEISDLYRSRFEACEGPRHYPSRLDPDLFDTQAEQRHAADHGALPADVAAELDRLLRADLLILQFPMWWFSVPAMMKGWVDRVLVYGKTYTSRMRYDRGLLRGRRAMLSVTLGGPEPTFAHNGRNGDIDLLLWPMNMTLSYVGYSVLPSFTAFGVFEDGEESARRLQRYKDAYRDRIAAIDRAAPLRFNGWDDWDGEGRLKPGVEGHSLFMRATP
jgi:NAD(P)H dehydrogenase (quinone)